MCFELPGNPYTFRKYYIAIVSVFQNVGVQIEHCCGK